MMPAAPQHEAAITAEKQLRRKLLFATMGNILEWMDFAIFAILTPEIAKNFFTGIPSELADLDTFAVFGGAFLMRPIGGIIFGHIGDRYGRKKALLTSVILMSIVTTVTGCLPNFDTIGAAAPVLLTICRLCQGLSVGGQLIGAYVLVLEDAPPQRKYYYSSLVMAGGVVGSALGSVVGAIMHAVLTDEQMAAWAWRIPFLFGCVTGIASYCLEASVDESHAFKRGAKNDVNRAPGPGGKLPIQEALRKGWARILMLALIASIWCAGFYFTCVWLPTQQVTELKYPEVTVYMFNMIAMLAMIFTMPYFGMLADRLGPQPIMVGSCLVIGVLVIPLAHVVHIGGEIGAGFSQIALAIAVGAFGAPMGTVFASSFDMAERFTSFAVSYNLAQMIFGGTAPVIASAIYIATKQQTVSAIWIAALAFTSAVLQVVWLKLSKGENIDKLDADGGGEPLNEESIEMAAKIANPVSPQNSKV